MNYKPEYKEALLRRMLPPNNESISKIAKEEGLSEQTLRNWRDRARKEGFAAPGTEAQPEMTAMPFRQMFDSRSNICLNGIANG